MNVPMKMKVIHMKKSNIHMNEGVLGDFPLTRRHVYTKCVSCDGHRKPSGSIYGFEKFPKND